MYTAFLKRQLAQRSEPVKAGLIGAGAMGKGLLYQILLTPGTTCTGLADIKPQVAEDACRELGVPFRRVDNVAQMRAARAAGQVPICADGMLVAADPENDVLVESSSAIVAGAEHACAALAEGVHVVLMNAEVDQVFGPALNARARRNGVVCTSCDGDQHGVLMSLISNLTFWGFDLVMAGNIKGFHDLRANPVDIRPEADKRRLDYRMCTAYTDGTKLNIEMSVLANALGLRTDVPGMHGPRAADLSGLDKLFDLAALHAGGPVVDYVLGAQPGGGVFAIGHHDQPFQRFMMNYYKMGEGPYYTFYRPYHLCHVEAMASILQPVVEGAGLLTQPSGFATQVFGYAKVPLGAGTTLDGLGGHCVYGLIENMPTQGHAGLPVCLAEDVVMRRDLPQDAPILMADVVVPEDRFDFRLYREALYEDGRPMDPSSDGLGNGHLNGGPGPLRVYSAPLSKGAANSASRSSVS